MNLAPLSTAVLTFSMVRTVPAPTRRSFCLARELIALAAAAVRKVISTQGRPPAASAWPMGAAAEASSMATTGMSLSSPSREKTSPLIGRYFSRGGAKRKELVIGEGTVGGVGFSVHMAAEIG